MKNPIIITCILASIMMLHSCGSTTQFNEEFHYDTFTTQSGTITLRDNIIASVEGGVTSDLSFKNGGRIVDMLVHPGDTVKKGQILARLGNNEGDIMSRGFSEIGGGLLRIASDTEELSNQTEGIRKTTIALYDERIRQVDINIKGLQNELVKNKKNLTDTVGNLQESFYLELNNLVDIANASLHEGDKILGITSNFEYSNDAWEDYLGTRVGDSKLDAVNAWGKLYTALGRLRALQSKRTPITTMNIDEYIQELTLSYSLLHSYNDKALFMIENSPVGAGLSYEMRNSWVNIFNTMKTSVSRTESQYLLWKANTTPLLTSSGSKSTQELALDNIRIEIENAQKNKNILLAEKRTKLQEIKTGLIEIQSKKWEIGTKISETKMNEFLAIDATESDIIRAPYDGIILERYMNIGSVAGQGSSVFRMTSEDKSLLKTYIDNSVYEYSRGDIIEIYNPIHERIFTGTITLLQNQKDPLHNKNYIEVTLSSGENVIGERMIIHFIRKKTPGNNGIVIPMNSIITRYGPPGVYTIVDNSAHFQLVEIISSDGIFAEVIGLEEDMLIITQGKENLYDGMFLQTRTMNVSGE